MPNDIQTPRTDAEQAKVIKVSQGYLTETVPADFARELERENTELRAALIELVRLKTLRDDLGAQEKANAIDGEDLRKALLRYGREKDEAWRVARKVLGMRTA